MRAFVMAAGKGTRLAPLTNCLPKPAIPVANEPAMGFLLRLLARYGYREVVSNISYRAEQMQQIFGDGSAYGVNLTWSIEPKLLGTAGGMKHVESILRNGDEHVLVLSGDGIHDVDLAAVVRAHREAGALATLVLTPVEDPAEYGVAIVGDDGLITGFQEKPAAGTELSNLSNTGIYVFEPSVFDQIPADTFYDFGSELIPAMVDSGQMVLGWVHPGYWNDIGGLEAFRDGNFALLDGRLDLLGERSDDAWPDDVLVHPTANVASDAVLQGPVIVGADVTICSGAQITRSVILPGATVPEGVLLAAATYGSAQGLEHWSDSWATVVSSAIV